MFQVLIPPAFMVAGSFILLKCLQDYLKGRATHTWPKIQGIVVESRIEEKGSAGEFNYKPVVTYEYKVDGTSFKSSNLMIGGQYLTNGSYFQAEKITGEFPLGRVVDVIYNPANHKDSVLQEGFYTKSVLTQLGIAMVLFFIAILSFIKPGFPFIQ